MSNELVEQTPEYTVTAVVNVDLQDDTAMVTFRAEGEDQSVAKHSVLKSMIEFMQQHTNATILWVDVRNKLNVDERNPLFGSMATVLFTEKGE